jgi:hypothetical protein
MAVSFFKRVKVGLKMVWRHVFVNEIFFGVDEQWSKTQQRYGLSALSFLAGQVA